MNEGSLTFRCPKDLRISFLRKCNEKYSNMSIELRRLMKEFVERD